MSPHCTLTEYAGGATLTECQVKQDTIEIKSGVVDIQSDVKRLMSMMQQQNDRSFGIDLELQRQCQPLDFTRDIQAALQRYLTLFNVQGYPLFANQPSLLSVTTLAAASPSSQRLSSGSTSPSRRKSIKVRPSVRLCARI